VNKWKGKKRGQVRGRSPLALSTISHVQPPVMVFLASVARLATLLGIAHPTSSQGWRGKFGWCGLLMAGYGHRLVFSCSLQPTDSKKMLVLPIPTKGIPRNPRSPQESLESRPFVSKNLTNLPYNWSSFFAGALSWQSWTVALLESPKNVVGDGLA
jgi:hypothetical protein